MATHTDMLVGRPTKVQDRERLLAKLDNGGVAVGKVNRFGELIESYLSAQAQRVLRELLAEGVVDFAKVPIARSSAFVLTATRREDEDLSYDRFAEPRLPMKKSVPGGTVPTHLEP
jgi:hypothetical protein